ncbi:MAG: DUF937 domain-containing protein [Granulosicoccus sp.]|nr:DUF937 domain-containing protein [Granulosicoccus sp.]
MSNLLDIIFAEENKSALDQMQKNFNLSEKETKTAVEELIPALSRGLQNNTQSAPGMDDLLEALRTGEHARYMEQPDTLGKADTVKDGNDILGHIFGDKKVSREVASRVSKKSGLSSTLLKKMLPVVASLVMGALSKQMFGGRGRSANRASTGAGGLLGTLLDSDRDGSVWDDVLGMAARTMLR